MRGNIAAPGYPGSRPLSTLAAARRGSVIGVGRLSRPIDPLDIRNQIAAQRFRHSPHHDERGRSRQSKA